MIVTKLGAIDIGSNSVRCLIVNVVYKDGYTHYKKVSMIRLPVRLGQDVFKYGKIRKVTRDRFLEGMKAYEHLLSVHGVQDFRAVATSAMREAKNGRQIVNRVLRKPVFRLKQSAAKKKRVWSSRANSTTPLMQM